MVRFLKLVLVLVIVEGLLADHCSDLCRRVAGCVRGSWCKGDPVRGSCHNLFYDSSDKSGGIHYHTHGMVSEYPVLCGESRELLGRFSMAPSPTLMALPTQIARVPLTVATSSSTPTPTVAHSTLPSQSRMLCSQVCDTVDACRIAGKGSYCKPNGTCTGLFFTSRDRNGICYHSAGSHCPEDFPVTCDPASGRVSGHVSSSVAPTIRAVVTTTTVPSPLSTVPRRATRIERTAVDHSMDQIRGRRFRSAMSEFGVTVAFEDPHLHLEFTYRGARTIADGLEYVIEGNFVRLRDGSPLRVLIGTVESIGFEITHHRPHAHHISIHIIPAGTVQNYETYVIVRLGVLPPVTCTEF